MVDMRWLRDSYMYFQDPRVNRASMSPGDLGIGRRGPLNDMCAPSLIETLLRLVSE